MMEEGETWETKCPANPCDDHQHCNCWYDNEKCCWCEALAEKKKDED